MWDDYWELLNKHSPRSIDTIHVNGEEKKMIDYIIRAGVDIRPESMDITWEDMGNALIKMKDYINCLLYTSPSPRD